MLFIVNKTAGSGAAEEKFEYVTARLDELGVEYSVRFTARKGHATDIALAAAEKGESMIVAVGGDGTVREVASALIFSDTVLGILPFGTGNDLVKPLGIPTEPEEALTVLLKGSVRSMDACRANGQCFFNIAGIGFDVDVLVETERYKAKHKSGMLPYFLGIVSSLVHKKAIPLRITVDGEVTEGKMLLVNAANGTHFGGGMKVAPDADPFDSYFDVIMVKYVGLLRFVCLLPGFIKGKHVKVKKIVTVKTARRVRIEACDGREYPIQLDGEIDEVTPVDFELLKGAVRIITPEVAR